MYSHEQQTSSLPAIGILANLTPGDLANLEGFGETMLLRKGEVLIEQGHPQACLHFVLEGELKIQVASKDALVTLGYAQVGGCVGEMSLLEPTTASATVLASANSRLWYLNYENFNHFVTRHPAAGAAMLRSIALVLAGRLRKGSERLLATGG
jgi:CRP-like cAMP-binding protein